MAFKNAGLQPALLRWPNFVLRSLRWQRPLIGRLARSVGNSWQTLPLFRAIPGPNTVTLTWAPIRLYPFVVGQSNYVSIKQMDPDDRQRMREINCRKYQKKLAKIEVKKEQAVTDAVAKERDTINQLQEHIESMNQQLNELGSTLKRYGAEREIVDTRRQWLRDSGFDDDEIPKDVAGALEWTLDFLQPTEEEVSLYLKGDRKVAIPFFPTKKPKVGAAKPFRSSKRKSDERESEQDVFVTGRNKR